MTGGEISILDVQGGKHHTGRIDHRIAADQDTCGVDQEHLSVREQLTKNLRGILRRDPIQHRAGSVLLNEAGDFVGADIEALPVKNRAWRVRDF